MAIEPETSLERRKLAETLEMMKRQDPTFRAIESEETGQTIISGMGELHLEVIRHRLERDFNLHCRVHKPRVSYKETLARAATVRGEANRQVAGQTLSATVTIRAEPIDDQQPVVVEQGWFPENESVAALAATMTQSVRESAERGGLKGCPLWATRIVVLESPLPDPLPSDVAIRIAAADAIENLLAAAGSVLLEPVMRVEVSVPEDHLGDVINDSRHHLNRGGPRSDHGDPPAVDVEIGWPSSRMHNGPGELGEPRNFWQHGLGKSSRRRDENVGGHVAVISGQSPQLCGGIPP